MLTKQLRNPKYSLSKTFSNQNWLKLLFITLLVLGLFFRVTNLDRKPVWVDETHTFSVASGYSDTELIDKFSGTNPISVETFLRLQYPNPDRNLSDSLYKLYTDVHPPLYFLIARSFVEWFGHSVAALRSASVVLSILTLPCIYWLCLELFGSSLVSKVATAIFCVSPFQVLYAQEARPYSLFTLVILLSGASLLWAMRTQKRIAWFVFSISLAAGLYSQLFFLLVISGYLAYVVSVESFRFTARLRHFLLAMIAGFIIFLPWLITVLIHLSDFKEKSSWIKSHTLSILGALRLWSENISLSFIDPRTSEYLGLGRFGLYFLIPFVLLLSIYSLCYLCIKTPKQVYLFVITLIISTALPLIAADFILGGNRQIWPRYLVPCLLGVQISVSYLLTAKIWVLEPNQKTHENRFWLLSGASLVTLGVVFCLVISQAETWWNKYGGEVTLAITRTINQSRNPLVIVNRNRPNSVLYFSLNPEVNLLFVDDEKLEYSRLQTDSSIFLLNPTDNLKDNLQKRSISLEMLAQFPDPGPVAAKPTELWKVKVP